jgi:hypothetical protein
VQIAVAHLALSQFADAVAAARLAIGEMPPDIGRIGELAWLTLIAATSAGGDDELSITRARQQRLILSKYR